MSWKEFKDYVDAYLQSLDDPLEPIDNPRLIINYIDVEYPKGIIIMKVQHTHGYTYLTIAS